MGFFESLPPPAPADQPVDQPEWLHPPDTQMPVSVGVDVSLGVGAQAAVYVSRVAAYANGVTFDLVAVTRDVSPDPCAMHRFVPVPTADGLPDDFLRFGVELPNGARLTNYGGEVVGGAALPESEQGGVLLPCDGGGFGRHYRQGWWLWPIPASGDLTLVCEWPSFGIPESRATLAGDRLRAAAAAVREIWPAKTPPR